MQFRTSSFSFHLSIFIFQLAKRNMTSDYHDPQEVPGLSLLTSRVRRFHDCLDEALERHRAEVDDELFSVAVLEDLARGCRQMGLPQEFAVRMACFQSSLFVDEDRVKAVFKTAYLKDYLKTVPMKFMRPSALLTFKTEAYLKEHYVLRFNVMTGVPEYKVKGLGYGFQPLDSLARNTMSINALKAGVDSWDKDLNRYIDSSLIPRYEPMADYLDHLPVWDGKDRVGELARRVKTDNKHWEEDFHVWMLSMVAQWTGKDRQHGNAIVPLLIGPQGSGKTTFCRRLLPETLQTYFSDRLSMKSENDIFIAMSSYALINIDEFDALSKSQQPILKYLLSKHDVKMRPPYGKVVEQRQRFASFIATTNNIRPLVDTTGSRRFVCVYADSIDNKGRLNYNQLYAQLREEVRKGRRYWFGERENARIMLENLKFQQVNDYETMVRTVFLPADETPANAPYVSLNEIIQRLATAFPTFNKTNNANSVVGKLLKTMGYKNKRMATGYFYQVISPTSYTK